MRVSPPLTNQYAWQRLAPAVLEKNLKHLAPLYRMPFRKNQAGQNIIWSNHMAYDEHLAERIRRGFDKARVRFEEKRMMGGLCFLVDGKMCVGVDKNRLMARIDPAVYESVLKRKGCVPMDFTGRPMRGFVFVNPEGLATDLALDEWLALALEFNPKAKVSRKKSTSASPARTRAGAQRISRKQSR
jgi:TfoX/Sxy family transcriptional regulator of competence genes